MAGAQMTHNPYQAPSEGVEEKIFEAGPAFDDRKFVDGLVDPMPSDAFDSAYSVAFDTFKGDVWPLLGPAFLLTVLNSGSTKIDEAIVQVLEPQIYFFVGLLVSLVFVFADVGVRMHLLQRWLSAIRFQASPAESSLTARQFGQCLILSIPVMLLMLPAAAIELVDTDMQVGVGFVLIAGALVITLGNAIVFPAMLFVIDQDCNAWDALRRTGKLIWGNKLGYFLVLLLVPVAALVGVLAFCFGILVSISIVHGVLAVAYNRVARPGPEYSGVGSDADAVATEPPQEQW